MTHFQVETIFFVDKNDEVTNEDEAIDYVRDRVGDAGLEYEFLDHCAIEIED